ncbi:MAG: sterile alpha motif-like domain-containing protein [Candidatus Paraimprobicoccus trichonymphae]|uniref:Sterile alpha motif-like domain-containing protein n=1 Tax=Candidatus Paraimprobicoccus trichonymphae TaxID=3033793 RepID=A0AA48HWZ0_9FIRM|nr:MAG: sterile alpha motif-like domain-containing protein [Candidatus Paraimprobicoccus trichonymphae]
MSFYKWLIKNYKGSGCPKGDLADDAVRDSEFSKNSSSFKQILNYLNSQGDCYGCISAFEEAFNEFEKLVPKCKKRL